MMGNFFIVWNEDKTEGYITNCEYDANYAGTGLSYGEGQSSYAFAFRQVVEDIEYGSDLEVQKIQID